MFLFYAQQQNLQKAQQGFCRQLRFVVTQQNVPSLRLSKRFDPENKYVLSS